MSPAIPEMERYRQITPGSRALWERAARVLPGGDTPLASLGDLIQSTPWTLAMSPRMPRAWDA